MLLPRSVAIALVGSVLVASAPCVGLAQPVDGAIASGFAPAGAYSGHWGVDFETPRGTAVRGAHDGVVSFAGSVAGMLSVTVDHGGGLKTSVSYLDSISVRRGVRVDRRTVLGTSGMAHDIEAVHFSVRLDGVYQDPADWLGCVGAVHSGLRLAPLHPPGGPYPLRNAARHPRRNVRSPAPGPPLRRRGRIS